MGALFSFIFPPKPAIQWDYSLYTGSVEWERDLVEEIVPFVKNANPNQPNRHISIWTPKSPPTGIVIFAHGLHEHGLRYHDLAHSLTAKGYVFFAIDHYAHGKSDGDRALITDYTIMVDDFVYLAEYARSKYPDLPLSVGSHSMGTLVAALALQRIPDAKCVLFSGPAIFQGPDAASPFGLKFLYPLSQTAFAAWLATILAGIDPKGAAAPIIESGLTRNLNVLRQLHVDPLHYAGDVMNRTAVEFFKLNAAAKAAIADLKIPLLCVHGSDDELTLPKSSDYIVEHAGTAAADKQCIKYAGLKHEVFFETEAEARRCMSDAVEFICAYSK